MGNFREKFKPDMFLDDVYTLDIEYMKSIGIKAFLFDIDNTLVGYETADAPPKTKQWFDMLHKNGFKTCIISNNNKERVKRFSESLGELYYYKALKPRKRYIVKACDALGVEPRYAAMVGDQLFTDIYGGKRMRMYTVLVNPISDKDLPFVRFKRRLEKFVLKGWSDVNK